MSTFPGALELVPTVVMEGVNPGLVQFVTHLSLVHQLLFGEPLVITSAKDGTHQPTSLHAAGRAVDIRTRDKEPTGVMLLLSILAYAAIDQPITVFDERQLAGEPHIHLEWHGS